VAGAEVARAACKPIPDSALRVQSQGRPGEREAGLNIAERGADGKGGEVLSMDRERWCGALTRSSPRFPLPRVGEGNYCGDLAMEEATSVIPRRFNRGWGMRRQPPLRRPRRRAWFLGQPRVSTRGGGGRGRHAARFPTRGRSALHGGFRPRAEARGWGTATKSPTFVGLPCGDRSSRVKLTAPGGGAGHREEPAKAGLVVMAAPGFPTRGRCGEGRPIGRRPQRATRPGTMWLSGPCPDPSPGAEAMARCT